MENKPDPQTCKYCEMNDVCFNEDTHEACEDFEIDLGKIDWQEEEKINKE